MIRFSCRNPLCGKPIRTQDEHAGKKGRCPHCKEVQMIPAESDAPGSDEFSLVADPAQADKVPARPAPEAKSGSAKLAPAKKMYREYNGADAGRSRGVAVKMGNK